MAQLSSSYQVTGTTEETLHESYTSDAAIEYGLWLLSNDADLQATLLENLGMPQDVTVPADVNGTAATLQVVALEGDSGSSSGGGSGSSGEAVPWVIWANSQTRNNTVQITGSGQRVYGGIHTTTRSRSAARQRIYARGVREFDSESGAGNGIRRAPLIPRTVRRGRVPPHLDIADFAPGGAWPGPRRRLLQHSSVGQRLWHVVTPPHYCTGKGQTSPAPAISRERDRGVRDTIDNSVSGNSFSPYVYG
jgi:hypothetical protein